MAKKKKNKITAFGALQSYCQISNAAPDTAEIFIYDEIGGWGIWAMDFVRALARIDATTIRVRIHSPGGFVGEAIAIHNALRKHDARIITEIDSEAASAASFIAQAGDERLIAANGRMMIHDVQGMAVGNESDFADAIESIKAAREAIIATYAYRTDMPESDIRAMMLSGKDTWMNAEEVVRLGFADRVEELISMGTPPDGLSETANRQGTPQANTTQQQNLSTATHDLVCLYGLENSVGSGQRDQGNKGDNMNQKELIAQLKAAGTDVEGLQNSVGTLTTERNDAVTALSALKTKHDALVAVTGDQSPAQVKSALEASARYTTALVDKIITGRRLLNLCGDEPEAVDQAKAVLASMTVEQLESESSNMATATKGMSTSQMNSDATDDHGDVSELDAEVDRVINLQKARHAREA